MRVLYNESRKAAKNSRVKDKQSRRFTKKLVVRQNALHKHLEKEMTTIFKSQRYEIWRVDAQVVNNLSLHLEILCNFQHASRHFVLVSISSFQNQIS